MYDFHISKEFALIVITNITFLACPRHLKEKKYQKFSPGEKAVVEVRAYADVLAAEEMARVTRFDKRNRTQPLSSI